MEFLNNISSTNNHVNLEKTKLYTRISERISCWCFYFIIFIYLFNFTLSFHKVWGSLQIKYVYILFINMYIFIFNSLIIIHENFLNILVLPISPPSYRFFVAVSYLGYTIFSTISLIFMVRFNLLLLISLIFLSEFQLSLYFIPWSFTKWLVFQWPKYLTNLLRIQLN